jgi:hypothetical protein
MLFFKIQGVLNLRKITFFKVRETNLILIHYSDQFLFGADAV